MRYSIISKGLSLTEMEKELMKAGARNVMKADIVGELFCELDEMVLKKVYAIPGLKVRPVRIISS